MLIVGIYFLFNAYCNTKQDCDSEDGSTSIIL